jgi:hypothetical protein
VFRDNVFPTMPMARVRLCETDMPAAGSDVRFRDEADVIFSAGNVGY